MSGGGKTESRDIGADGQLDSDQRTSIDILAVLLKPPANLAGLFANDGILRRDVLRGTPKDIDPNGPLL
jgi:hypothetical protein